MVKCAIKKCPSRSEINDKASGVTFHNFPVDENLRRKWIKAIGISDDWVPQKNSSVCSKHFSDKDIFLTGDGRVVCRLAVPSLHLNDSDVESDDDDVPLESQRSTFAVDKLKGMLEQAKKTIKNQRITIKNLQDWKNRNVDKVELQTRIIEDLMEIYELRQGDIKVLKEYILETNAKFKKNNESSSVVGKNNS